MADRFGAKRVFRVAIGRLRRRLDRLRHVRVAVFLRGRPFAAGNGRSDDDAIGPAGAGESHAAPRTGRRHGLAYGARPDRSAGRSAGRRFHHDVLQLALDLPDQRADRARSASGSPALFCPKSNCPALRRSTYPDSCLSAHRRLRRRVWTFSGQPAGAAADRRHHHARLRRRVRTLLYLRHARRAPFPILDLRLFGNSGFRAAIVGGSIFRIGNGAVPFLLPLMFQLGFGMTPFQSGMLTFASAFGAIGMKFLAKTHIAAGRIPHRADQFRAAGGLLSSRQTGCSRLRPRLPSSSPC